jgi:hypothetical protein
MPDPRFESYAPHAYQAYETNNQATGPAVDGWPPVRVDQFRPSSPYFAAQLSTDGQGHYRVAFRGSNELADFVGIPYLLPGSGADFLLAHGAWTTQQSDAIRFVGEAMLQIKREMPGMSFDDLRASFDCTGHSLGGSLCETAAKFYGLAGMNIDGPGVAA